MLSLAAGTLIALYQGMDVQYVYPSQNPRVDRVASTENCDASLVGADCFDFKDLVDAVNPLQQLPVIGTLYRAASGDTISTFSRLVGGALLGGPIGFMVAAVNAGFEAATGGDIGEHVLAMFSGEAEHQVASAAYTKAAKLPG